MLAIAILLTILVVKPLYLLMVSVAGTPGGLSLRDAYVIGDLTVIVGFGIGWLLTKRARLEQRLANPIPGHLALVVGVWAFGLVLIGSLLHRFIALDAYLLMLLKARFVTSDFFPSLADVLINGFLLYGIGKALLSFKPIQQVTES